MLARESAHETSAVAVRDPSTGKVILCPIETELDPLRKLERLAAIGLMTAGVVHDMGNLMHIINSGAKLAARKLDCGAASEALEAIVALQRAVDRASALGRTLLSRASPGAADPRAIDLRAALAGMVQTLGWAAGPAVRLEIIAVASPLTIVCDSGALEDALVNLIANAREAMPNGGRICVSAWPLIVGGRSMAEIRVSDTGYGMPPEIAAHAFEPLFSAKAARSGTGLGLASVAAFVRDLDGEASIESEPGRGATIILRIPLDET